MKNLLAILVVLSFTLVGNTLSASTLSNPTNPELIEQERSSVFVHITAVKVKKTKNGALVEIKAIKAGKRNASLKKNQFSGEMVLKDNKVGIKVLSGDQVVAGVRMPKGFKISNALAQELGATQSIVMSGGSTMLQPQSDSLLWFEIQ